MLAPPEEVLGGPVLQWRTCNLQLTVLMLTRGICLSHLMRYFRPATKAIGSILNRRRIASMNGGIRLGTLSEARSMNCVQAEMMDSLRQGVMTSLPTAFLPPCFV